MASEREIAESTTEGVSRRSFLQSSGGVATGLAVTVVPSAALAAASPAAARAATPVPAHGDVPTEPVMAYVHSADRSEVTIVAGTSEMTYRDPVLVKRLLDAANAQTA